MDQRKIATPALKEQLWLWTLGVVILLANCFNGVVADFQLTILHTNDVESRIQEFSGNGDLCSSKESKARHCFGGMARMKTMVHKKKADHPDSTIVLDAGNQFRGAHLFYGVVIANLMNIIGYDAMAIGNHEFTKRMIGLERLVEESNFPVLSSNAHFDNTLRDKVKKATVIKVGKERIGVVGYTTPETANMTDLEKVTFTEELEAVQAQVDELTSKGINKIIALGHSGYNKDLYLAENSRNVDVVVGGLSHTFLYNGNQPSGESIKGRYPTVMTNKEKKKVLVVQTYGYGKYLGYLNVHFNDLGEVLSGDGNPILLDASVKKDPEVLKLVAQYRPTIRMMRSNVVGISLVNLAADEIICRTEECILGNLVADAYVYENINRLDPDTHWIYSAIALVNSGSLRGSINAGPVTVEEIFFVLPYEEKVNIVTISGATLREVLEVSISKHTKMKKEDKLFGGFLQMSGLRVVYDTAKAVGHRVVCVMVLCTKCLVPIYEPLESEKHYNVVTNSFLMTGKDGYDILKKKAVKTHVLNKMDADLLMGYVNRTTQVKHELQGRIRFIPEENCVCDTASSSEPGFYPILSISFLIVKYPFSIM